jgi:hypothetical protein
MSAAEKPKRDWVTIIVTIAIGFVGTTIFTPLINSLISELNKPYVQILMNPNMKDNRSASFLLSNTGGLAATHLKFLLQTPQKILSFSNLSSENASITNPNAYIRRESEAFCSGKGVVRKHQFNNGCSYKKLSCLRHIRPRKHHGVVLAPTQVPPQNQFCF